MTIRVTNLSIFSGTPARYDHDCYCEIYCNPLECASATFHGLEAHAGTNAIKCQCELRPGILEVCEGDPASRCLDGFCETVDFVIFIVHLSKHLRGGTHVGEQLGNDWAWDCRTPGPGEESGIPWEKN